MSSSTWGHLWLSPPSAIVTVRPASNRLTGLSTNRTSLLWTTGSRWHYWVNRQRAIKALQVDAERSANDQILIRTQLEREADELRREVKAIRADLVTPDTMPSVALLQQRIQEENLRADLQNLRLDLVVTSGKLGTVADELRQTLADRAALGTADLTDEERGRLEAWTGRFREMLRAVGVTSFPVEEIQLPVTGKPSVIGYDDVGFQASASDAIRLRWSYALSLMRVSRGFGGPHPGVLMMDEPRQQEVAKLQPVLEACCGRVGPDHSDDERAGGRYPECGG